MSLNDYKITQGDIASKGVQAAPDVLSGSPAENKAIFDRLISEAVAVQFNALIDKLVKNGAEAILRRGDDSVLYLRLNADKVLEVSTDGKEYFSTVGSGHIVVDKYGKDMPKGLRLKFDNFEVREENGTIIVHGVAEEIAGAIPNTEKGAPKGVATLDAYGRVIQPQEWQSNANLLHNWYFANPVNQRGKTTYDETGYTIDRWSIASASSLTVLDDCIEITGSIHQTANIGGGYFGVPLTLSVLDRENNLYAMEGFTLTSLNQGTSSSAQGEPLLSASAAADERIGVSVAPSRNSTIRLRAVKLEIGTQQTLAHQNADGKWVLNEIPSKGEELIRCQSAPVDLDGRGGAAPAGFGLGNAKSISAGELDRTFAPGFYCISATMTIAGTTANYWYLIVSAFFDGSVHCRQELYPISGDLFVTLVRMRKSSAWYEWEYENPPLELGVEYRTTERYANKPVYVKRVSIGALPNASTALIDNITCVGRETIVSTTGIAVRNDGAISGVFPYKTGNPANGFGDIDLALRTIGTQSISGYVTTTDDKSSYSGYLIIKYTKSTD